LVLTNGIVHGVHGDVLEPTTVARGHSSSRMVVGDFELHAQSVIGHQRRHRRQP
jgi:hypothetical protein